MKLLITGGTGFIGSHFLQRLQGRGGEVILLDLWPPDFDLPEGIRYVRGDVRDRNAVARALEGCDSVLHLAAAHHDFGIDRETYYSVNGGGAEVLCSAMAEQGVRRFCFFSSVAIYGEGELPEESTDPQPINDYGRSKLAAERVVAEWTDADSQNSALVIRPGVVFGPRNYANMYKLIRQIESGRFLPVGDGSNRKSMAFVDNVVDAALFLWNRTPEGFHVYNYVDKPDLESGAIVDAVYRALGKSSPRARVPLGLALALATPLDWLSTALGRPLPVSRQGIRKLASVQSTFAAEKLYAAGFEPRVTLAEGIGLMVEWYGDLPPGSGEARLPPSEIEYT